MVSSREFLNTRAERTLAGRMALEWQRYADEAGLELWTGWKRVRNGSLEPGEDEECPPSDAENMPPPRGKGKGKEPSVPEWGGTPADGFYNWATDEQQHNTVDWSQNSTTANGTDWSASPGVGTAKAQRGKTAAGKNSRTEPSSLSRGRAPAASPQHEDWSQPNTVDSSQSAAVSVVVSGSDNWSQPSAANGAIAWANDWSQPSAASGANAWANDWSLPNDTETPGNAVVSDWSEPSGAVPSQPLEKSDNGRSQQPQPANQLPVAAASDWDQPEGASLSSWAVTPNADDDWSIAPAVPAGGNARTAGSNGIESGRSSYNASRGGGRGQRGGRGQQRGGRGGRGSRGR